jgi:hypothetical protein
MTDVEEPSGNFASRNSAAPSPAAALSNQMVRLMARYIGRRPTKTRATLNANLAVVTFGDTLTREEWSLLAAGHGEMIVSMRRILHHACAMTASASPRRRSAVDPSPT